MKVLCIHIHFCNYHKSADKLAMKLRMYRGLWGVLTETDGERAGSPFLDFEKGEIFGFFITQLLYNKAMIKSSFFSVGCLN